MQFAGAGDLDALLRWPARKRARRFHRFPPFSGEVTHEPMIGKAVF